MLNKQHKIFTTKSKKEIIIFDDLFSYIEKQRYFDFVKKSFFTFSGNSNFDEFSPQPLGKPYLTSVYSNEDLENLGLTTTKSFDPISLFLKNLKVRRAYVYVSDHTTTHYFHSDPGVKTLIYYPIMEWKNEYGGETMFANEEVTEIEYSSMYTPGRVILFDATIPHKMSAPASTCPFYRFTFVINYEYETLGK
jgi:hypothetical protein